MVKDFLFEGIETNVTYSMRYAHQVQKKEHFRECIIICESIRHTMRIRKFFFRTNIEQEYQIYFEDSFHCTFFFGVKNKKHMLQMCIEVMDTYSNSKK